jgi:hypothetical protein
MGYVLKLVTSLAVVLTLTGCGSVAHKVSTSITGVQLDKWVGQPYTKVVYERPDFGNMVARERVANGQEVMKHVGPYGTSESSALGIWGKQDQNYRVIYFLVDGQGTVRDWASELYIGGQATCWVGFCGSRTAQQVPVEELDRIVKTSSGQSITNWR